MSLLEFSRSRLDAGCRTFVVHARIAILAGLSPKQNRTVPKLNYERVYRLKRDFPQLDIVLNGGVTSVDQVEEILKQGQNAPLSMQQQASIMYALTNGLLDDVEIPRISAFEAGFYSYMASNHPDILDNIAEAKDITSEIEEALKAAIENFKANVPY